MSTIKRVRWHLEDHRGAYASLLAVLIAGTLAISLGTWHQDREAARRAMIRSWPVTTATILESRITMSDSSTDKDVGIKTTVTGRLRYPHPQGEVTVPFFLESGSMLPLDWQGTFKPGNRVSCRYHPEKPAEVSFIDFTGHP